ncbi:MAG: amidohydrolase family protein [Methanothrix sp.]|nr:amidohydrolase family protein [Methanothrix sp.]
MPQAGEILLSGTIIFGDDFQALEGYLCIEDGMIKEIGEEQVDADLEGIICPRFVNAHVHVGDSSFKDPPFMSLSDLVGPGGLKARLLAQTPRSVLLEGMRRSLQEMVVTGTCAFADFREGGQEGAKMLCEAQAGMSLVSRILGRAPEGGTRIPEGCWGLGISSTRDHDLDRLKAIVAKARMAGQAVAIHAGEAASDDISDALSLDPDFLVHLNRATHEDLKKVAKASLPVVVCPRSNLVTDVGPPNVKKMVDLGIKLAVGTDNVMLNSPNIFEEMQLLVKALLHDDRQVFKMCTLNGAEIMGIDQRLGSICEGKEARVMVMDRRSDNLWGSMSPLASIVRRARPSDILAVF